MKSVKICGNQYKFFEIKGDPLKSTNIFGILGKNNEEFFIQDGIVEFFNDILVVLSSSAINTKNLSKEFIDKLSNDTKEKLSKKDINDQERYILNHQLDVLKDVRV